MRDDIPPVSGETISGQQVAIPGDLTAPTLLILAFQRSQQSSVESWVDACGHLSDAGVDWYVVQAGDRRRNARGAVEVGVDDGVTEAAGSGRIIALNADAETFRLRLGLPDDDVYALLVDPDGNIRFRERGPCTADKEWTLRAVMPA